MANKGGTRGDTSPDIRQIADTTPLSYGKGVTDAWVVEGLMQMQKAIGELCLTSVRGE